MKYEYPMACEYLGRVRDAERHIEHMKERVANMRLLLTDTSVHLSDMPHSDSPDLQKNETIYAAIDEMEREITEAEKNVADIKIKVGQTICMLSDPMLQKVLILRYLKGKPWKEIAREIQYGITQTYRFHEHGLTALESILATL